MKLLVTLTYIPMIKESERNKTQSFHRVQNGFKFPSSEFVANKDDTSNSFEKSLSFNEIMRNKPDLSIKDDQTEYMMTQTISQVLPRSDTPSINSGNVINAAGNSYYSFANISDNTTFNKNNDNRLSFISASGSSYSTSYHHKTSKSGETKENIQHKQKIITQNHPLKDNNCSKSEPTVIIDMQTKNKTSYKVTPGINVTRKPSTNTSIKRQSMVNNSLFTRNNTSFSSLGSIPTHISTLKRTKAIRCKGGLLQYFTQMGFKAMKKLKHWKLAIRKKLFSYKHKHNSRKLRKHTTSHLKRTNGYVSNINRTISVISVTPSEKDLTDKNDLKSRQLSISSTPHGTTTNINMNSIRRSPSSIKRAATILTNINTSMRNPSTRTMTFTPTKHLDTHTHVNIGNGDTKVCDYDVKCRLVKSKPSISLSSIIRQPSIVVNNKVIPLSKFSTDKLAINEEDEDEYIINTTTMEPLPGDSLSISSKSENKSIDKAKIIDASIDNIPKDIKLQNARRSWDHYLRSVIASRIKMRLQIAEVQQYPTTKLSQSLLNAIVLGSESDSISSSGSEIISLSESGSSSGFDTICESRMEYDTEPTPYSIRYNKDGDNYNDLTDYLFGSQWNPYLPQSPENHIEKMSRPKSSNFNIKRSFTLPTAVKI